MKDQKKKSGKTAARVTQRSSSNLGAQRRATGRTSSVGKDTMQRNAKSATLKTAEQKKASAKKKPAKAPKRSGVGNPNSTANQLIPYALVCFAPFAAISFILRDFFDLGSAAGAFGSFIANFLCGMLGIASYTVPIFMMVLGIRWRRWVKNGTLTRKLVLSIVFVVLLSGIIHVFQDAGARGVVETSIRTLYEDGEMMMGSGVIGGFFGELLGFIFRLLGTCLLCIPLLLVVGIYLVGLTPVELYERIAYKVGDLKERIEQRSKAQDEKDMNKNENGTVMTEAENAVRTPHPTWRRPRPTPAAPARERDNKYFTFEDEEDEAVPAQIYREVVDIAEDVPAAPAHPTWRRPVTGDATVSNAAMSAGFNGEVVDAPFSPQYYQKVYEGTEVVHGESRVTDAGFGAGIVGEGAVSHGESRVTDPGFCGAGAESAPAAHGESRVTDPGFGAGLVGEGAPVVHGESRVTDAGLGMGYAGMADDSEPIVHGESRVTEAGLGLGYADRNDAIEPVVHGESRVTDPGFSAERLAGLAAGNREPGESRVTDPGFCGANGEVTLAKHGESRLTEAGFDGTLGGNVELAKRGESRLTQAGFDGTLGGNVEFAKSGESRLTEAGFDGTLGGNVELAKAGESRVTDPGIGTDRVVVVEQSAEQAASHLTEPSLGTAFGDRYAEVAGRHTVKTGEVAAVALDSSISMDSVKKTAEPEPEPEPETHPYVYPTTDLLSEDMNKKNADHSTEIAEKIAILRKTLADFRINIKEQVDCFRGPTVTRYEVRLEGGVSMRQIQNRIDDISLYMAAPVRIAAVQGKPAVGIEVPNTVRDTVYMRTMLESDAFKNSKKQMEVPLGLDIGGVVQMCDIAAMPHLLIAGTTGSGKSVCINSILLSLIYKTSPEDLRLILIDPKQIEFAPYEHVPHLYMPIVTDMQRAAGALACAVQEMERRFSLLKDVGVRDIASYNEVTANDPDREHLPRILIVIDEFADLKMSCANNDPENFTCRLAQKARAAGIHLIIGTQRPSVDVITGKLKTNVASRIAFMVKQQVDSRTILDMNGAEMLAGRGDMLFAPANSQDKQPRRIQGAYVSDSELERVISFVRRNNDPVRYNQAFMEQIEVEMARAANAGKKDDFDDLDTDDSGEDPKFVEAVELAVQTQKVATSLLQRRLGVGYGRAAKIIDRMEELGLVSPAEGNKPRKLLPAAQGYLDHIENVARNDFDDDEY